MEAFMAPTCETRILALEQINKGNFRQARGRVALQGRRARRAAEYTLGIDA